MARPNDPGGAPSNPTPHRRRLLLDEQFIADLDYWLNKDPRTALRLWRIVRETLRDPFEGIGKPERMKHDFGGCWSRRLTEEHRIIYRVTNDVVDFLSARGHYQ